MDTQTIRRELSVQWSDGAGEYEYVLKTYENDILSSEKIGNRDWADRTSNHYKLTLPDQPVDQKAEERAQ